MVKTTEVLCDGCGAPIDVGEKARFVTCSYCRARLQVEHSDSAVWTEAVAKLEKGQERIATRQKKIATRQKRMSRRLDLVELRRDREALEHEWEEERKRYLLKDKDGTLSEPGSRLGSLFISGAVLVVVGAVVGARAGGPFMLLFSLLIGGFLVVQYLRLSRLQKQYRAAEAAYFERCEELDEKIAKARRRS